eukprot:7281855-Ditylum_brightwellii.AAC.1
MVTQSNKNQGKSLKYIVTGKDTKSNCLQFYHPPSKQFLSNATYRLDPTLAAGYNLGTKVYYKQQISYPSSKYIPATIISVPISKERPFYTIQCTKTSGIYDLPAGRLQLHDPEMPLENDPHQQGNTLLAWITDNCNATLFLENMPSPKKGTLHYDAKREEWSFHLG